MGYLYLCIALFAGSVKGFCGKKTSGAVSEAGDAMLANTVRMLFCIVIGFFVVCLNGEISLLKIPENVMWISLLSGVSTSVFVVSWLLSVRKGAYMMLDVFLMLGTVIPATISAVLFDEKITAKQWIGLGILLIAVIIMCSYSNSIKGKMTSASFLLLVLCGTASGIADFSQKLFVKTESASSGAVFNFYTYVFSSIALVLCYLLAFRTRKQNESKNSVSMLKNVIGYIAVMSLCLFLNSYFKTLAAGHLPAARLYPLMQGLSMILSTMMSAVFFKEKLTLKCVIGVAIAFVGLIFINVL